MSEPTTVMIVDDHKMFREGLRARLEREPDFAVVGEAATASEALALMPQATPAIVLLDIRMPGGSGIELARDLRRAWPEVKIVVLSAYDFEQYVRALGRIGIEGYLLKDESQETLIQALREIAQGRAVLPPRIASTVMRTYRGSSARRTPHPTWDLTVREIEIVEYIHEGLRNAEIAERLKISHRTVESHVSSIMAKLGAGSRVEAVRIAVERGVVK